MEERLQDWAVSGAWQRGGSIRLADLDEPP